MLGNIRTSASQLLPAVHATDTATATGSWTLISNYDGAMLVTQDVGTVTSGKIAGAIYQALDDSGASSASAATFADVTTAASNKIQSTLLQCNACGPYIKYVGTVTTGPADVSVSLVGQPKY